MGMYVFRISIFLLVNSIEVNRVEATKVKV